jgi:hypothetical protein
MGAPVVSDGYLFATVHGETDSVVLELSSGRSIDRIRFEENGTATAKPIKLSDGKVVFSLQKRIIAVRIGPCEQ